jgi:cytochrome bd-type quinol oxidase subunit 2
VRPFLPPLLAGALARGDIGVDFSGTDYRFLESPGFLLAVFALAVVAYVLDRRRGDAAARVRDPASIALAAIALAIGALLFAGSLADGRHESWPGLVAGAACAALGYAAVATLFARARRRLEGGAANLLSVYADGLSLAVAGLAIALPPIGLVALVAFAVLIARSRGGRERKYEGLRVLR